MNENRGTLPEDVRFEDALRGLIGCHEPEGVLSVYLDIDPATATREGYEAALLDAWKPLHARSYDDWTRGRLEYEIAGVTEEVRGWREAPGRSVAMFFSGPGGLRVVLPLHFPVRSLARFEARPVLSPLIAALEEHRRYCVIAFDKEQARIVTVFLGEIEEEIAFKSDVPGRSAVGGFGGYMQARYARHREHHLHEHARRAVEHLWAIDRSRPMHALVLAGPEEALAALRATLPTGLARIVEGTMPVEMFASTASIIEHVAGIEASAREREDGELVAELITRAEKGGNAALGWDETLQALGEGRVHLLVLPHQDPRPGVQCPEGHFLATSDVSVCPLCGEALWKTDDIAESAVRAALLTDAQVRFLAPAAGAALAPRGAAAVLRY